MRAGAFPRWRAPSHGATIMTNTILKTVLAAGALLAATAIPASAQGFGFGFSTGDRYNGFSGYYSDYGRPYYGSYYGHRRHRYWDNDWRYRRSYRHWGY